MAAVRAFGAGAAPLQGCQHANEREREREREREKERRGERMQGRKSVPSENAAGGTQWNY